MSPDSSPQGVVRSAAEINAEIRAVWLRPGADPRVPLSGERRAEYQRLLAELLQVGRRGVGEAA